MGKTKYIDAEAFKRRILSYGTVHEGDRIPIPFYKRYFAEADVAILRWVCEEVDDTPTADVVAPRWIPVTERLPEEEGQYLVSCNNDYEVEIGRFYIDDEDDRWFCCDWSNPEDIVAWMPLPEPYKGGEEE